MAKPIEVTVTGEQTLAWAKRVAAAAARPEPLLRGIGEDLVESTKQRFTTSTAPDGTKWAPNRPVTLEKYAGQLPKSARKKDGSLNKRGQAALAGKKPLIGRTKTLATLIHYNVNKGASAWELIWGSPMEYAAMQQFGGKKSEFAHLWGDIPARPFIGLSPADLHNIEELTDDWLASLPAAQK